MPDHSNSPDLDQTVHKLDAFLRRHRPAAPRDVEQVPTLTELAPDPLDDELPVLTEMVDDPAETVDLHPIGHHAPPPPTAHAARSTDSLPSGQTSTDPLDPTLLLSPEELDELVHTLRQDIEANLQAHIQQLIKQKLARQMAKFLHYATQRISAEVIRELAPTLEQQVRAALRDATD